MSLFPVGKAQGVGHHWYPRSDPPRVLKKAGYSEHVEWEEDRRVWIVWVDSNNFLVLHSDGSREPGVGENVDVEV